MTLAIVAPAREELDREAVLLARARDALSSQAQTLAHMANRLDFRFCRALELILGCRGRVVVCGLGKSGLIGRKIAATFSCSGTPSYFLHAGEAFHGDLGMVTPADVLVLISNSGSTEELVALLPHFKQLAVPIIAMVGNTRSRVARAADVVLDVSVDRETCPHNLVPTTSTLSTLAIGDALAVAVMSERSFTANDFARFHPRGALGRRLTERVSDVMQARDLPLVAPEVPVHEALLTMSAGRCGLVVIVNEAHHPIGIVTDGDLRRGLQSRSDLLNLPISSIMTAPPVTIRSDALVHDARERMHGLRIKALVVVDGNNLVEGVVEIFDD